MRDVFDAVAGLAEGELGPIFEPDPARIAVTQVGASRLLLRFAAFPPLVFLLKLAQRRLPSNQPIKDPDETHTVINLKLHISHTSARSSLLLASQPSTLTVGILSLDPLQGNEVGGMGVVWATIDDIRL
ncbi:hypothetical protein M422DRAFT_254201 [Sphaerobolus stellatus SS14]|uniref:Uncharacterized protein n=1 Tax=Sphaerobolus stellatus (strain SS14) TaxID=990650 RepID=A0A0C9UI47_SPHS4|nr:hypothetical protein M422DRAFT_254201 [Sphaerobolus stellatus SS14]